jgi:hypothetical protein
LEPGNLDNNCRAICCERLGWDLVFIEKHDVTSKFSQTGEGVVLECRRLDSMNWLSTPTYIKMDIEGSEPQALAGGEGLIQENMPVLGICLYHRSEHFWQLPNFIHSLAPESSIFCAVRRRIVGRQCVTPFRRADWPGVDKNS